MESNRFEDSFKDAFSGAELSPSATVWTNVELGLEKASGGKMKRNLLLFQLLAAASVAFALGISAVYYLNQPVGTQQNSTRQASTESPVTNSPDQPKKDVVSKEEAIGKDNRIGKNLSTAQTSKSKRAAEEAVTLLEAEDEAHGQWMAHEINKTELSSFVKTNQAKLMAMPEAEKPVEPDPEMLLQAKLRDIEKKYEQEDKKSKKSNEKAWASVGFGAGSYKPNRESLRDNYSSSSVTGQSYSVGLNVASRISKRFIVQGGISYLTQNADFNSSSSDGSHAALSELIRPGNFSLDPGSGLGGNDDTYVVNSNMQYVSIPVQAGYLVIDRAFGLQVNGGISTDLFLSNTLTADDNNYQKVTQTAGKESPYRTVNFSGLLGTEVSYKIANQYRISLNPGLRYSLNSIYKDGVPAEVIPVTFDVSLLFRYIFK